ncbi:MAG: EAL domain-containing protein [Eubacteriales bacterium]|nr:EAL domain-containing protein [Eubacteriales bacterium]MDD4629780.1 EAL domain-containing protein [Eubacteriales bacterium]
MITPDTETQRQNRKSPFSAGSLGIKHTLMYIIIFIMVIVFISGLYLHFAWNKYKDTASSEAIMLAQSLESVLHTEYIANLSGGPGDLEDLQYIKLKSDLMRLVETTNPIRFAYILDEREGNIVILLSSESPDSTDYSPPGQLFEEANDIYREPFRSGKTILTEKITDRWGSWISVLVPIKDQKNGNVIATLGIGYSASDWQLRLWKQMIPDIIIVLSILVLFGALLLIWIQRSTLKGLNKKLAFDELLYHSVFEQAPIGIAIMNDKNFVTQSEFGDTNINPIFEEILGRKFPDFKELKWTEITHPDDLQAELEKFEQFITGKINSYSMEKRFVRPDGSSVWTNMKASHLTDLPYKNSVHLCLLEDISESKGTAVALKESERSKSVLLSHLPGMAYRCNYDRERTMQFASAGCFQLTGYAPESLLYNKELSFNDLIVPEYHDALWKEWERILSGKIPFKYEYEIITGKGERKWVLEMGQGIYNEQGKVEALEGIILDISDRKEMEDNLRYSNEHDLWTGLYNRRYFEDLLTHDAKMESTKKRAVISINLSSVHILSLTYGFHYSQELIKKTAEALNLLCTYKRRLFNTYENRFVFYVKDYEDKNELIAFCKTIDNTIESAFSVEKIGHGIGIVEIDDDNKHDVEKLLKDLLIASERALHYFDKDSGFYFFDKDMEAQIIREENIKHELTLIEKDPDDGGLFLQYQPILDLKSNQICGFEALARIKSDKLGLIPPLEFIPIAEKTKLIITFGKKVTLEVFRFLNKLRDNGYSGITVSINISAIQLLRNDFNKDLFDMITEMQINPANISLEITESMFADNDQEINRILGELKDSGIHTAIDDFGTGYSSLARVRELNVNCLKIDKYFIDKLVSSKDDEAITGDIVSMAHKLGHCAIAEGVEHEKQKQYLQSCGCDKIQGYIVSKPLDEEKAIEMLKKQTVNNNDCHSNDSCC